MAYKAPPKLQKVMIQPINHIFRYLQTRTRVQIWLNDNLHMRIEAFVIGFDEYMNLVLDDAVEFYMKSNRRRRIGRILLKGDNITLIRGLEDTA